MGYLNLTMTLQLVDLESSQDSPFVQKKIDWMNY